MATDWGGGAGAGLAPLVADLGRIQADRTQQQGRIWGSSLSEIGNLIAQAPQREALAQERQARALDLQGLAQDRQMRTLAMQREQAGSAALAKALSDPANQGDPEKVYQAVAAAGFPEHGQKYLDLATKHSEALQTLAKAKETERQIVADTFEGADPNDTVGLQSRFGLLNSQGVHVGPYAQLFDQVGAEAAIKQITESAPENVKAKRARAEKAAEEAAKVTVGHPGDVFLQNGTQIGSVPDKPAAGFTLAPGQTRYDADGNPIAASAPLPPKEPTAGEQAVISLSPAGLDTAALQFKKTGQLPPMGMGSAAAQVRAKIINRAATLTADDVTRIEAGGLDIAGNKADYHADSGSLTSLKKQRDAIGAFENTAQKNIDLFLQQAGKVVDTGSPMANALVRAVNGRMLGSPDQAAYDAARQVAINEVAKIVSNPTLSGTLSDAARKEVEAFNPSSATLKQSVAVMRLLKQDMGNRKNSLDQAISDVQQRIKGGTPPTAQAAPPAPAGWKYVPKPGGGWTAVPDGAK